MIKQGIYIRQFSIFHNHTYHGDMHPFESALLFIDQVVRVNLMISNLASRYADALSADRYADLLLGRSL